MAGVKRLLAVNREGSRCDPRRRVGAADEGGGRSWDLLAGTMASPVPEPKEEAASLDGRAKGLGGTGRWGCRAIEGKLSDGMWCGRKGKTGSVLRWGWTEMGAEGEATGVDGLKREEKRAGEDEVEPTRDDGVGGEIELVTVPGGNGRAADVFRELGGRERWENGSPVDGASATSPQRTESGDGSREGSRTGDGRAVESSTGTRAERGAVVWAALGWGGLVGVNADRG